MFEDNLSHNCRGAGIYYWHNDVGPTQVVRYLSYHCATAAIDGAYENTVSWRDNVAAAHRGRSPSGENLGGFAALALDGGECGAEKEITGGWFDQAGRSTDAFMIGHHSLPSSDPYVIRGCRFQGGTRAQVLVTAVDGTHHPHNHQLIDCTYGGPEADHFWVEAGATGTVIVDDAVHGRIRLRPLGVGPGVDRPEWNARVETLP